MRKIFMIAFANIRKTKSQTVSLGLMFFISALLLNIGLLVFINYGGYFGKLLKELNTSDMYVTIPFLMYDDSVDSFIRNHNNVTEADREEFISLSYIIKPEGKENYDIALSIYNAEQIHVLSNWKFVGEYEPLGEKSIYLTNYFNIEYGFDIGDTIILEADGFKQEYSVKGFIENIFESTPDMGILSAYLSDSDYIEMAEELGGRRVWEYYINLKEENASVGADIVKYIQQNINPEAVSGNNLTKSIISINISLVELSRTMMASVVSAMIMVFSFIIVIICMIVVRFRINNSINEDITKLGSLSAAGYTSRQIISSVAVQFILISVIGGIAGIVLSYPIIPVISEVLAAQSALTWEQGFDAGISGFSLFIIIIITALISYISAGKIKKLNPIIALRGGITTHSFKKNHLPLEKTKGRLSAVLAGKSVLNGLKQSVMVAVIAVTVGFGASFAFGMAYNTLVDTKTFVETPGVEISNLSVAIDPYETDRSVFAEEILKRKDVWKAFYLGAAMLTINDVDFYTYICEDYSVKETQTIYEGRYPIHDNEISLGGIAAELIGVSIGDTILIFDSKYIVTGLQQGANYAGKNASLTEEGYKRIKPDYRIDELYVHLIKGSDTVTALNEITEEYKDIITGSWNIDAISEKSMGTYINIVSKVGIAVMIIMLVIIILVLYFVINSTVIRRKRELGIQKAIGFTTFELMNQVSLSFLPAISVGVMIGCILGIFFTNPIMSIAQRGMGIMKTNYIITPGYIFLIGLLIILVSYVTSLLITSKIRNISAYALITE